MFNSKGANKFILTKDLVADQTYTDLTIFTDDYGLDFDVTEGFGTADEYSSVVLFNAGVFPDQYVQGVMKFVSPTSAGDEDFGVILRVITMEPLNPGPSYYYAYVSGQFAQIGKVVDGSFIMLTESAFALAQDQSVTITFQAIGNQLSADFEADGGTPATLSLATVDSDIGHRGLSGFGSVLSSVYCSSFVVEEL